jgi:hypothetical protein
MKNLTVFVAAVMTIGACSQGVNVNNGNPTGVVGGVIVDASNEQPIGGATVNVIAGGSTFSGSTDTNGQFAVTKVPAGSFILSVVQMGYVTAQITDTLVGAVGNFPVNNPSKTVGPVGLLPAGGTFTVHVLDETGAAVANLKLSARTHVRQILYVNGLPMQQGGYEVQATTGADGSATFMGLPIYGALAMLSGDIDELDVAVPPTKIMGSEVYNFLGSTFSFFLNRLSSSAQVISLPGPNSPLQIVDSNIEYLKGRTNASAALFNLATGSQIPINGPINVAFNQAISSSSLRTIFLDVDGKQLSTTAMATVALNQVTITPSAPLPAGKRFNLILHASAATDTGTPGGAPELNVTTPFWTQPPSGSPITVVANSVVVVQPVGGTGTVTATFELSEPIGVGFGTSGVLDCVAFYEVLSSTGFNNDGNTVFQGDWKSTTAPATMPPTNLVCRQTLGVVGNPQINVTAMTPVESTNPTTNPTLITGFTSRFSIPIAQAPLASNQGPCKINMPAGTLPGCSLPATGTKVHLIFSRQDSTTTVKKVNGVPVPDNIVVTLP